MTEVDSRFFGAAAQRYGGSFGMVVGEDQGLSYLEVTTPDGDDLSGSVSADSPDDLRDFFSFPA